MSTENRANQEDYRWSSWNSPYAYLPFEAALACRRQHGAPCDVGRLPRMPHMPHEITREPAQLCARVFSDTKGRNPSLPANPRHEPEIAPLQIRSDNSFL